MIYVQVSNGKVINRAIFNSALPNDWPDYPNWHQNDVAQVGWLFDGTNFTASPSDPPPPLPADEIWRQSVISDTDYKSMVTALVNATPTQIRNYVTNNVTDLPSAKILLAKMLLLLAVIIRRS